MLVFITTEARRTRIAAVLYNFFLSGSKCFECLSGLFFMSYSDSLIFIIPQCSSVPSMPSWFFLPSLIAA
jgi:hypothetical protein